MSTKIGLVAGLSLALLASGGHAETIQSLVRESVQLHPTVRSAQAQLAAAQNNVAGAKWQFAPTLSFTAERVNQGQTNDPSFAGDASVKYLRLQQPVWSGGRLTAGLKKSEYGLEVARANLDDARLQIALKLIQAYGDWVVAKLRHESNEKSLQTHQRLHKLVQNRIEQGVAANSDEVLAISRIEGIRADIEVSRSQQEIAKTKIEQLYGSYVNLTTYSLEAPRLASMDLASMVEEAMTHYPAYRRSLAQLEVQRAVVSEKEASLSPELYVRAERQYGNYTYANLPDMSRVFVGVSTSLGAGLSRLTDIDSAKASLTGAAEEVEAQKRILKETLSSDYALVSAAENRLRSLRISLKNSEDVLLSYERQFLAGRKSWLDVMNSVRELSQAEIQVADASSTIFVLRWRLWVNVSGLDALIEGNMQ